MVDSVEHSVVAKTSRGLNIFGRHGGLQEGNGTSVEEALERFGVPKGSMFTFPDRPNAYPRREGFGEPVIGVDIGVPKPKQETETVTETLRAIEGLVPEVNKEALNVKADEISQLEDPKKAQEILESIPDPTDRQYAALLAASSVAFSVLSKDGNGGAFSLKEKESLASAVYKSLKSLAFSEPSGQELQQTA